MGSVIMVVDPATNVIKAQYEYDSFGNRVQVIGTEQQPYGFTGREFDGESGLHYFRARHLDTGLGQFVQRDPIGFWAGDLNIYAYVWNNPYGWSDPSGLAGATDWTAGISRDKAVRAGLLTTAFSAIAILAYQTGELISAAISNSGSPGMGHDHDGEHDLDDEGGNGGPDSDIVAILAAAMGIAAHNIDYDNQFGYIFDAPVSTGQINVVTQLRIEGDSAVLSGIQLYAPKGQPPVSRKELLGLARSLSSTTSKKSIVINALRIKGGNKGPIQYVYKF